MSARALRERLYGVTQHREAEHTVTEFIATQVRIESAPHKALEAVTTTAGHKAWWTPDCEVGRKVGDEAAFRFDSREVVFRIDRLDAHGIELTCVRTRGQSEWQGTRLTLRVVGDGAHSYVDLLHEGFASKTPFFEKCAGGWKYYLESLRAYCETGRGTPYGSGRVASASQPA